MHYRQNHLHCTTVTEFHTLFLENTATEFSANGSQSKLIQNIVCDSLIDQTFLSLAPKLQSFWVPSITTVLFECLLLLLLHTH
jgi:hypothetical protein